ncbi:MAG: hypothetical protein L0Y36_07810 [Planctomycetales bacterium]|nr:hypothetical protein [Planctomycetales bacterium]
MIRQKGCVLVVLCWACVSGAGWSGTAEKESLFSPHIALIFVQQAIEIRNQGPLDAAQVEQAMTFLAAARTLDELSTQIPEQYLRIGSGCCYVQRDYTADLTWALNRYLDERSDLEAATRAVRCMLERLNARTDREILLDKLIRDYEARNPVFVSDAATQLALLAAEKSDARTAMILASAAYEKNRYNQLAFDTMVEFSASVNLDLTPSAQLLHLREMVELDPYDLTAAVCYADRLRRAQLYDAASEAYAYAVHLFEFLYPDEPVDAALVGSWIQSCCQVQRMETQCLELTDKYRDPKRLDLMLEAAAGRAMVRLGRVQEGKRLLESAAKKAEALLAAEGVAVPVYPEQLAWFYSFVLEQPDKALAWSNRAFQEAPERRGVAAMFGYTLAVSGQRDLAGQYAEPLKDTDQIAAVTMALAAFAADPNQALLALRAAVEMAPDTYVAEKAIRLLRDKGSDYIPTVPVETIRNDLDQQYGRRVVPQFVAPADRCSAKLLFNGSDFHYGAEILPRLVIENTGGEPLIIDTGGCLSGEVRVDAALKGDLNVEIPNLLTTKFRPSRPIQPGEYVSVPLELNTGKLRSLLTAYPQANVRIQFVVYLDPVLSENAAVENRLKGIKPVQAQIQRTGIVLSRDFLLQRLEVLTKGQSGQKLEAARLFTGLLAERKAFELSQADFGHIQTEQSLLVDAVRKLLKDDDWKIRVQAMSGLLAGSIPLEYGLVREISNNLNSNQWPVRLLAMYILAQAQPGSFQKVLDWMAQYDASPLNRRMAVALGGREPAPLLKEVKEPSADPNAPADPNTLSPMPQGRDR